MENLEKSDVSTGLLQIGIVHKVIMIPAVGEQPGKEKEEVYC